MQNKTFYTYAVYSIVISSVLLALWMRQSKQKKERLHSEKTGIQIPNMIKANADAKSPIQKKRADLEPRKIKNVSTTQRVQLLELGSKKCQSCKAMVHVLKQLKKTYASTLHVRFIDVWKHPKQAQKYNVRMIPTQILLDPQGKELTRHIGYWSARSIRKQFATLGYSLDQRKQQ